MKVPEGRLAPIRTPIGSEPENATIQLLHQTCRSRIDRLKAAGVIGSSSGKYGTQQRFSASTRSPMSSVRQKRYALTPRPPSRARLSAALRRDLAEAALRRRRGRTACGERAHLIEHRLCARRWWTLVVRDHLRHSLLPDLTA